VAALTFWLAVPEWALCQATSTVTPPPPRPAGEVQAVRTSRPPEIDGDLTDEPWAAAPPATHFTQRDPDEGKPSTQRTEVRFLYDDDALYVGVRLFDSRPELIAKRLSTRDEEADADYVTIFLDSMHDHLTGAIFRVSASNVQQDFILHNDSFWDSTWDAVWQSQVSADADGWTAEIRIPLSQLRFVRQDRPIWGVNVERFIRRNNESSWLEMVPKNDSGLASRMIHLSGLDGLQPRRRIELLPYVASRSEFVAPLNPGNPYNDGSRAFFAAGIDLKWGVTSNLTLNGSVNPDFGQVEVDPAVVNLSAFETFYEEKRPFFLEGSQIFNNFGQGGANSFWGFNTQDPRIFYSRRIGRTPQIPASAEFADIPSATTILGAAKLTGKTSGGWSVGLLEAVTEPETARTRTELIDGRSSVEPLTNYFVARVQRDVGSRAAAGFMTTAVNRRLGTPAFVDALADHASVVGADAHLFIDADRQWVVTGKLSSSHVHGTAPYIEALQQAPQRYYQRPDANHLTLDPTRTSLAGFAGRVNLNRNSGLWRVNAALWGVSPGFESNDLGFHNGSDRAGAHGVFQWRNVTPDRFTRARNFWVAKAWTWNYARELQTDGWFGSASLTFRNYWEFGIGLRALRTTLDDRLTRGGPSAVNPFGSGWDARLTTDSRKRLSLSLSSAGDLSDQGGSSRRFETSLRLKPSSMLTISTGPALELARTTAQYIRTVEDGTANATYGSRYVFGTLERTELSMTTRVGVVLSPRLSLQIFVQPLLSSGDYSEFKELAAPRTFSFNQYTNLQYDPASGIYTVDPDPSAGAPSFSFGDPDFNLKSARLNAVFRWEIKPGSTFYAVWTRQQVDQRYPGDFSHGRDTAAMLSAPGDDIFLLKLAYWMGR
jgi:hypothetical protein